jgi:cysteine sulfinate desulfinase/cysteine desulfurase-like protein
MLTTTMVSERIYLDNAATTPLGSTSVGNHAAHIFLHILEIRLPSTLMVRETRMAIESARKTVAKVAGC